MLAYAAIPLTCWLCALVAIPRKARIGNEVEELVYARLLGRQQRLVLLACIVSALTVGTAIVGLPHRAVPDLAASGGGDSACVGHGTYAICDTVATGVRSVRERQEDGTWAALGAVTVPQPGSTTDNDVAVQTTNPVAPTTERMNIAERLYMVAPALSTP
jgi:hypothetical protein